MDNLPPELLRIIASFLDVNSHRTLRLASTRWFNAVHYDDFIFYYTTNEQLPQILQRLQRYSHPVGVTFDKAMFTLTKQNIEDLGRLTHLTKLGGYHKRDDDVRIYRRQPVEDLHPLTKLTNLEELALDLPEDIIYRYSNIKRIFSNVPYGSKLDLTRFSKLESVHLSTDSYQELAFSPFEIPSAHLTYLHINCLLTGLDGRDVTKLTNLKHLVLKGTNFLALETLTKLQSLELGIYNLDFESYQSLQFMTALTNLKSFKCAPKPEFTTFDWEGGLSFINSRKLTALEVNASIDLARITKLGSLQILRLNEIVANIQLLGDFTALTRLKLFGSHSQYVVPIINSLTNLRALDINLRLDWNEELRTEHIFDFKKVTALEEFKLVGSSKFIDDSIQHLRLTYLRASWVVPDEFLQSISNMTTLKKIQLDDCKHISDDSLLWLTGLTNLTNLKFWPERNTFALTGVTLTRLTSLRVFACNSVPNLQFENESLKQHMPRLYQINIVNYL